MNVKNQKFIHQALNNVYLCKNLTEQINEKLSFLDVDGSSSITADGKSKKKQTQPTFPDGTAIPAWFNDTTRVDMSN